MRIHIGEYRVYEVAPNRITLDMGDNKTFFNIHFIGITPDVKPGDTLPLFTELTFAKPRGQDS